MGRKNNRDADYIGQTVDDPGPDRYGAQQACDIQYSEDEEYCIRYGKEFSIVAKAIIYQSGDAVVPEMFPGGVDTFEAWLKRHFIVTKAEYEKQQKAAEKN